MAPFVADERNDPEGYRGPLLRLLFRAVGAGDSAALVGASSMGKSRLLRWLSRDAVAAHYLADGAAALRFVLVDGNALASPSEWGLYERLLGALVKVSRTDPVGQPFHAELVALWETVLLQEGKALLARRYCEVALDRLCGEAGLALCVILDEFDAIYEALPAPALANLRALRDEHKYRLSYLLILREHPARMRPMGEVEGFYELFSRTVLGLTPYNEEEAHRVVAELEQRKGRSLPPAAHRALVALSGGHPGLIVALFEALPPELPATEGWQPWAVAEATVMEECSKLWDGLAEDEQEALVALSHDAAAPPAALSMLRLKGLVQGGPSTFFSPLLAAFLGEQDDQPLDRLVLDTEARTLRLGDESHELSPLEFNLLRYLYDHAGQACAREAIIQTIYGEEYEATKGDIQDNRVDTLIRRLRDKIEPNRGRPRYLLTVRCYGYKLLLEPASA